MPRFQAAVLLLGFAGVMWPQDKPSTSSSRPSVSSSSASKPAAHSTAHGSSSLSDPGVITDGVYRNPTFGFSYKLPFGWVDRTREMQDDSGDSSPSRLLLAIFERPPEATGETVNSAVVIAAEPISAYPGLKTAADYFGPLTELTTAKGFEAASGPYPFSVGTTSLVRGDFSKPRGTLTMHQSSLATLEKGYVISFTFIGGSEDEVNQLIEKLSVSSIKK
ncbi:MAG TPA: hypothetical protein VGZ28_15445 [Terriglobales bacterium]|jgi:hypothetical protein|nr:hypothetical protein [Terriglobales bacterium]